MDKHFTEDQIIGLTTIALNIKEDGVSNEVLIFLVLHGFIKQVTHYVLTPKGKKEMGKDNG